MKGLQKFALSVACCFCTPAWAVTITVDTLADDFSDNGNCTLTEAVVAANTNSARDTCPAGASGLDTIDFSVAGIITMTIQSQPAIHATIQDDLHIDGGNTITVKSSQSGFSAFDIFYVPQSLDVDTSFESITIAAEDGFSAAILNEGDGSITLNNVTASGYVGGNSGDLTALSSSITGDVSHRSLGVGNLEITNSDVIGAVSFNGTLGSAMAATITNSTFTDGTVLLNNYPMITIDGSQFRNSTVAGPMLGVVNSNLMMTDSTVDNNHGGMIITTNTNAAAATTDFVATIRNTTISNSSAGRGLAANASVDSTLDLTVEDVAIIGHLANQNGAGMLVENAVTLKLRQSEISGNDAGTNSGGGLFASGLGFYEIENTTFSGNTGNGNFSCGAGVCLTSINNLVFVNNTVANNFGPNGAHLGGINHHVANNLFAGTTNGGGAADDLRISQAYTGGFNLVQTFGFGTTLASDLLGAEPDLQELADNGGPTQTHALGSQSEAINGGSNALASSLSVDQRGQSRIKNDVVDIGAFESDLLPPGTGSIGDLVYQDFNGNGTFDGLDTGFENIKVVLFRDDGDSGGVLDDNDTQINSQMTDSSGAYDFQGLGSGSYIVFLPASENIALTGATITEGTNPRMVSLSVDQDFDLADFGFDPAALVLSEGPGNTHLVDQFANTANIVSLHLGFTASSENNIEIEDITLNITGDGDDELDLDDVNLYADLNGNGMVDGGEPLLSGPRFFAADNGSLLFNTLGRVIPAGQTEFWLVTIDVGESACLCEDYRPSLDSDDVVAKIQGGAPVDTAGTADGRIINIKGGSLSVISGNNQGGLIQNQLPEDMVISSQDQYPACGGIEWTIRTLPMSVVEGMYPNGQSSYTVPLGGGNEASAGFTFGETGGTYALRATYDTQPAGCTATPDFVDFQHTAAGVSLTDSLMSYRSDENQLRTFVQTIEAMNEVTVELAPDNLTGFTLESVAFDLAGQNSLDESAPFEATLDMQDVEETDTLAVTLTVTLPSGLQQTATVGSESSTVVNFPTQAIGIPSWFSTVETIAEGVTAGFEPAERNYTIGFEYPTDFIWTDTVDDIVALLGGSPSELPGGFRFMAEASYDIDSNSSLSAGIERDIVIFNRPVTIFGSVAAGFDQNFEFTSTTDPVGTLTASTSVELGEKSFARTVLVYGVPVTAGLDLSAVAQLAVVGRIYLNEDLEFSQFLISPEPSIQMDVAASISALFGLAKAIATASPTAAAQIHLPYSSANGLEFPRFGGQLTVDLMVEASLFYGLASAEVGSAMLGPYTWGDFISAQTQSRFSRLQAQAQAAVNDPVSTFISTHALAGDVDGRALLLFTENVAEGAPDPELMFRYDDGSGLAPAAPLRGTTTPDNRWEMDPSVTFIGDGDAVAVWTSNGGPPSLTNLGDILNEQEIAWSLFSESTETWSAPTDLTSNTLGDGVPDIDYDANSDQAVVVWVQDNNAANSPVVRTDWEIASAVYDAAAGTWSATIPVTADSASDYMPAVASRGGITLAVWSEDADGELFVDPGLSVGDDGTITDGSNLDPSNNDARLVWSSFNGVSWTAKQTLYASVSAESYTQMADITGFDDDRLIAVWIDKQATLDQLYYAVYDSNSWGPPVLVVESEQFIEDPSVTVDDSGTATIVYRGYTEDAGDGNGYDGNVFTQTVALNLPANVVTLAPPAPSAVTDSFSIQLFPVSALSGNETRIAWFDKGGDSTDQVAIVNTLNNASTLMAGCTETTVDDDADDLIDRLDLTVSATIASEGKYAVSGDLFDSFGQFVAYAQSPVVLKTAGSTTFDLSFPGPAIAAGPGSGPYRLSNVSLLTETPALVVASTRTDVCVTSALTADEFEAAPLRFDQDTYRPDSTGMVILEHSPSNAEPGTVDNVSVRVWSNADIDGIDVTLTETGPDTGLFSGPVQFDSSASNDGLDQILVSVGSVVIARFNDPDSADQFTGEAQITADQIFGDGFEAP